MSSEDGIQATGSLRPLLAPILHSLILCILVLSPTSLAKWSILAFHLKLPLSLARSLILTILMQWLIFAFMWTGITIRGHNLRDLLGRGLQNLPDIKMGRHARTPSCKPAHFNSLARRPLGSLQFFSR